MIPKIQNGPDDRKNSLTYPLPHCTLQFRSPFIVTYTNSRVFSDTFHKRQGIRHVSFLLSPSYHRQAVIIHFAKKKTGFLVCLLSFLPMEQLISKFSIEGKTQNKVSFSRGPISQPHILPHLQGYNQYLIPVVELSSLGKFTSLSQGKQKAEENTFHTSDGQFLLSLDDCQQKTHLPDDQIRTSSLPSLFAGAATVFSCLFSSSLSPNKPASH